MKNNPAYPNADETICLDFDGIIHDDHLGYHDGSVYGEPFYQAVWGLKILKVLFEKIVICSTKARLDRPKINGKTGRQLIVNWLVDNDLSAYINEVTAEKPPAKYYIDDRSIGFEKDKNKRWKYILTEIIKEEF